MNIKSLSIITMKPVIFCFNCSLEQLENREYVIKQIENYGLRITDFILFNPLEEETLNVLIQKAYETLGLISFLTAGEKEARAWTITRGTLAPQAAGVIHTDFEKKFIKADVVSYEDFVSCNGWSGAREKGKAQICGKDYEVKDGDVVEFKIGS